MSANYSVRLGSLSARTTMLDLDASLKLFELTTRRMKETGCNEFNAKKKGTIEDLHVDSVHSINF